MFLESVLKEVRNQSISTFNKMKDVISDESKAFFFCPNEHLLNLSYSRHGDTSMESYQESTIHRAISYIADQFPSINVVFLTDDEKVDQNSHDSVNNYKTLSFSSYIESYMGDYPELSERLYKGVRLLGDFGDEKEEDTPFSVYRFPKLGTSQPVPQPFLQGVFFSDSGKGWEEGGSVIVKRGDNVEVRGLDRVNRALDGDVVVVELLSGDFPFFIPHFINT